MIKDIQKQLQEYIKRMEAKGVTPSLDEMNSFLGSVMDRVNNVRKDDFEGYSPQEMYLVLHFLFEADCPVQLNRLSSEEYSEIPIFRQVKRKHPKNYIF